MKKLLWLATLAGILSFSSPTWAQDVHVNDYYRKDGTYVRPHIRSAPDGDLSNNYGASQNDSQLLNPTTRDNDHDGTPNYIDQDDDNDGTSDNQDSNQYGGEQ